MAVGQIFARFLPEEMIEVGQFFCPCHRDESVNLQDKEDGMRTKVQTQLHGMQKNLMDRYHAIVLLHRKPAVADEEVLVVGLQVRHLEATEEPGRVRPGVVVPDAQRGQRPERLRHGHDEHVDAAAPHRATPRVAQTPRPRLAFLPHQHEVHLRCRS